MTPKGGQNLLNMVAGIKLPDHHELDDQAGKGSGCETGERCEHKDPVRSPTSAAP